MAPNASVPRTETRLNTSQELRQRHVKGERQYLQRTQAKFLLATLDIRYERTAETGMDRQVGL